MEEIVGLGNASDVWRGRIGEGNLHLSLSGRAGRPRPRGGHYHVSARRRRSGRQRRLDVGLGGRRGRDAQALRRRRAGGHISADRYAVERPRNAPPPSRWARVPGRPGIRTGKVKVELRMSGDGPPSLSIFLDAILNEELLNSFSFEPEREALLGLVQPDPLPPLAQLPK